MRRCIVFNDHLTPDQSELWPLLTNAMHHIIEGRFWIAKAWLLVFAAALLFSCAPAVLFFRPLALPPAYQLKSEKPLADTALLQIPDDPGERSHGAKLTPRLFGSVLLFVSSQLSMHPYVPATLGGCVYLLAGILVGYRITEDRLTAVGIALLLAGLYAANACFSMNFVPKPFDGVALGMVALTMIVMDRPWLFFVAAFLACWCDERAILSLGLVGVTVILMGNLDAKSQQARCAVLVGAIFAYVCSRKIASTLCGWSPSDMSMLGENLLATSSFAQLAAWTCFEGAWMPIALAIWVTWKKGVPVAGGVLALAVLGSIASCLIVLDISRAAAFSFPLVFAAFAILVTHGHAARSTIAEPSVSPHSPKVAKPNAAPKDKRLAAKSRVNKNSKSDQSDPKNIASSAEEAGKIQLDFSNTACQVAYLGAAVSLIATNFEVIAWTIVQPLPSSPISLVSLWFGAGG